MNTAVNMQDNPSYSPMEDEVTMEPNPCYSAMQANTDNEPIDGKGKKLVDHDIDFNELHLALHWYIVYHADTSCSCNLRVQGNATEVCDLVLFISMHV